MALSGTDEMMQPESTAWYTKLHKPDLYESVWTLTMVSRFVRALTQY